jgi:hypothetical protein
MSHLPEHRDRGVLRDRLRGARAVTAELMSEVIGEMCRPFRLWDRLERRQIERFIGSGAWTDAVLALIGLELPQWKVRRIAYDGGEWYCALSRARELADWLDRPIETYHVDLPLAILSALVEVQRCGPSNRTSVPTVPRDANPLFGQFWCDNFA